MRHFRRLLLLLGVSAAVGTGLCASLASANWGPTNYLSSGACRVQAPTHCYQEINRSGAYLTGIGAYINTPSINVFDYTTFPAFVSNEMWVNFANQNGHAVWVETGQMAGNSLMRCSSNETLACPDFAGSPSTLHGFGAWNDSNNYFWMVFDTVPEQGGSAWNWFKLEDGALYNHENGGSLAANTWCMFWGNATYGWSHNAWCGLQAGFQAEPDATQGVIWGNEDATGQIPANTSYMEPWYWDYNYNQAQPSTGSGTLRENQAWNGSSWTDYPNCSHGSTGLPTHVDYAYNATYGLNVLTGFTGC